MFAKSTLNRLVILIGSKIEAANFRKVYTHINAHPGGPFFGAQWGRSREQSGGAGGLSQIAETLCFPRFWAPFAGPGHEQTGLQWGPDCDILGFLLLELSESPIRVQNGAHEGSHWLSIS